MAKTKYRCWRECFAYNKHFKRGDYFPALWLESGYNPMPEYFVAEGDYEDKVNDHMKAGRTIYSAADDPRPTAELVAELKKIGLDVPAEWNRKRIWMLLKEREMATAHTEQPKRGRPPKE